MMMHVLFPMRTLDEFSKDQLTAMFIDSIKITNISVHLIGHYCWSSYAGSVINTDYKYDYVADIEFEPMEFTNTMIRTPDGVLRPVMLL